MTTVSTFQDIPKKLEARHVRGLVTDFDAAWATRIERAFNEKPSPITITYRCILEFEGLDELYFGFVDVNRDGTFAVRIQH